MAVNEIDTTHPYNPIKHVPFNKHGDLERLDRPLIFNYGAFPRTWMSPAAE